MQIDRDFFRDLRVSLDPLLKDLGVKLNVTFSHSGGSFDRDGSSGSLKLNFVAISADGKALSKEESDFIKCAELYGLKKEDLGATFQARGRTYKIIGFRRKATLNKVITENESGAKNVWPVLDILQNLGRPAKEPIFGSVRRHGPLTPEERESRDEARAEARGS